MLSAALAVGVMQERLKVRCTHATISCTGSRKHFPEEAARGFVRTFTEQLEHVVGRLDARSLGVNMEEHVRELPRDRPLTIPEVHDYIGALVGDAVPCGGRGN